jgi:hypothetical protein
VKSFVFTFLCVLCRSRWPRCLRRGSAAACLLGLLVRNPRGGHEFVSLVSVVCCQVEACATGRSLVQRSLTECDVSECDLEMSTRRRPGPLGLTSRNKKRFLPKVHEMSA